MRISMINGPNLNLLGIREPEIYGTKTLDDIQQECRTLADELGCTLTFSQSNHEGAIIDTLQDARQSADGVIINPGAFAHTSVAVRDAINALDKPVVEVHISNIHRREDFRAHSYLTGVVDGMICGLGTEGYRLALRYLAGTAS
ncbi:MAG: type II 3-dehydroquinate dehydratase [Pseudomonadota bacterium]